MILNILFIIIGFILLVKGADFLVDGSIYIAKKFHIPEIIIGLTIISIGTSMPELMVSISSSLNGYTDMAIGNVIGSNISNVFLILGVCAAIKPLKFKEETVRLEIPLVIFSTALLYILGNNGQEFIISNNEGVILIIFFILFIAYNIFMARREISKERDDSKFNLAETDSKGQILKSIFKILLGIVALKYGGDFVVNNASDLATKLGISEQVISLTILAISTSLPELVTSVIATIKNQTDMAIGNVIGSNIFNILLIVGTTAIISPISYSISYNKDIIVFIVGMIVLQILPFIGSKNKISRWSGVGYVIAYLSYIVSLVYINF